jgi:hypothetical protein
LFLIFQIISEIVHHLEYQKLPVVTIVLVELLN